MSEKNDDSLRTLMQQAQQGDKAAYATLLHTVTRQLRPWVLNKLHDTSYAEDVLQEILLSIHKARHTYDASRPFRPWMVAIANFRLQDHLRQRYRAPEQSAACFDDLQEMLPAPEHNVEHSDLLQKSLSLLPEKQRMIIKMMHVDGYTAKEVAGKTGMSLSAVKVSAHRAYKKLAQHFEKT